MILLAVLLSFALLVSAVPIFLVFGLGSSLIAVGGLDLPWSTLIQVSFGALTKQVLLAIPLFVFAGTVMLKGGSARRLVDFSVSAVGHLPGGLGIAMVLAMGFFAAFCGSILAAISAVGTILMPKMIENGYPKPFVIVLAATAALLEALIPPSNAAIIYSSLTGVPVSKTFAAGILPGLVLMGLLIAYVAWHSWNLPRPARAPLAQVAAAGRKALPALFTPIIIMGGIYGGLLTPSESAAAASVWAIILGIAVYRELDWRGLVDSLRVTAETTTVIFAIIAMATFLSVVLTYTRAPQAIIDFFIRFEVGPLSFMILAGVVLLILGTFLELVPVFYLSMPIFLPICLALKVDLLHFYVFFAGLAGIGIITPPVCVGVYTAAAVVRESPDRAFKAVPGFVVVAIIYGLITLAWPELATWIPKRF